MLAIRLAAGATRASARQPGASAPTAPSAPDAALRDQHRGARRDHRTALHVRLARGLLVVTAGLLHADATAAQPGCSHFILGLCCSSGPGFSYSFWLWQLLAQYRGGPPRPRSARIVNYLTTCLTYGNSCVNPFLYTLLTKNYRDYRQRSSLHGRGTGGLRGCLGQLPAGATAASVARVASVSSSSQQATETIALSQAVPRSLCAGESPASPVGPGVGCGERPLEPRSLLTTLPLSAALLPQSFPESSLLSLTPHSLQLHQSSYFLILPRSAPYPVHL